MAAAAGTRLAAVPAAARRPCLSLGRVTWATAARCARAKALSLVALPASPLLARSLSHPVSWSPALVSRSLALSRVLARSSRSLARSPSSAHALVPRLCPVRDRSRGEAPRLCASVYARGGRAGPRRLRPSFPVTHLANRHFGDATTSARFCVWRGVSLPSRRVGATGTARVRCGSARRGWYCVTRLYSLLMKSEHSC